MLTRNSLLRDPLPLLIRFSLAAGLLFLFREEISHSYLALMVPVVNGIFRLEGLAVEFIRQRDVLQLVYGDLGFRFTVHDIIYQNLTVGVALFVATPGQSMRWKAKWIAIVIGLLSLTHLATLYLGGYVIVWDYVAALPDGERAQVARQVLEVFPRDRGLVVQQYIWPVAHLGSADTGASGLAVRGAGLSLSARRGSGRRRLKLRLNRDGAVTFGRSRLY